MSDVHANLPKAHASMVIGFVQRQQFGYGSCAVIVDAKCVVDAGW